MPLAAHARWVNDADHLLEIHAAWGDPEALDHTDTPPPLVRAQASRVVTTLDQAAALGTWVAAQLVAAGAQSLRRP